MKCELFREALFEGRSMPEAGAHAASCEACAALLRRSADLDAALRFDVALDPKYAEFRKRLLVQKIAAMEPAPAHLGAFRLARISLIAAALAFLFLLPRASDVPSQQPQQAIAPAPQRDVPFELQKVDDVVKLSWKGAAGEYRILKGPTPAALKPVESVKGLSWIDRSTDSAPIVFYKIEAL